MRYCKKISNLVSETEYELARYKYVLANFPDAQTFGDFSKSNTIAYGFKSKSVNSKYNNFTFFKTYGGISVSPFYELEFSFNNKQEIIKIHSMPKQISLVNRSTIVEKVVVNGITAKKYINCLKFSKFLNSLDKNNFAPDCTNQCRIQILQFIQEHPGDRLIHKNLEPRIKKLLLFI
jgi:hypothetical protein